MSKKRLIKIIDNTSNWGELHVVTDFPEPIKCDYYFPEHPCETRCIKDSHAGYCLIEMGLTEDCHDWEGLLNE